MTIAWLLALLTVTPRQVHLPVERTQDKHACSIRVCALNSCYHCALQDQMVLEMRDTIKALQDDCRSLAAAITQMSVGADVTTVLQTLPPTLVQVRFESMVVDACIHIIRTHSAEAPA